MPDDHTLTLPSGSHPDPGTRSAPPDPLTASGGGETPFDHPGGTAPEAAGGVLAGRYRLRELLGEGGMGSVWLADQLEPVRRAVAVKVIKRGLDSARVLARFEAERQALAMMDHPHIARVLDGGATDRGQPFFVMEVVRGDTLTGFCDARRLGTRERLDLFAHICSAVQHAHQKGVIHRDLKPSNILVAEVDGQPVPKVIDFGLAKAVGGDPLGDRSAATAVGTVLGTPPYMAPEQATPGAVDVDTRADVYALGAVLYELLTGTTPIAKERFARLPLDEAMRLVREEEPPTPSRRLSDTKSDERATPTPPAVAPRVRHAPDLDWVVMKAIAKERERRYESASALAADVRRFLADEPVQARPPTAGYRVRKFVRRNKGAVIAGGLVLAAVVAGIVGTALGLVEAQRQRDDANDARGKEAAQRIEAEMQAAEARTQRDRALAAEGQATERLAQAVAAKARAERAEEETLTAYRESTNAAVEELIGSKPEYGPVERKYMERTLQRWQAFAARAGDDERSQALRAEGHLRIGLLLARLGRPEEARPEFVAARDQYRALAGRVPAAATYAKGAGDAHNGLGTVLSELGKRADARREYEATRDVRKGLADRFPDDVDYQLDLATARHNLGMVLGLLGEPAKARTEYEASRDGYAGLAERFPDEPVYRQGLATVLNKLALLAYGAKEWDEAVRGYEAAIALWEELVKRAPANAVYRLELGRVLGNLGNVFGELRRRDDALRVMRRALANDADLVERFPGVPAYRRNLAVKRHNLGNLLSDLDRPDDAVRELEQSRDLLAALAEKQPTVLAYRLELFTVRSNLARVYHGTGRAAEAEREMDRAVALMTGLADQFPDNPAYRREVAVTCLHFARVVGDPEVRVGWYERASAAAVRAEKLPQQTWVKPLRRDASWGRAVALARLKRYADAEADWVRAIDLSPPDDRPALQIGRAATLLRAGRVADAEAVADEHTKPDSKWTAAHWYDFAGGYAVAAGKSAGQERVYADRAVELLRKAVDDGFQDTARLTYDPELAPLRDRADFRDLLADLTRRFPPKREILPRPRPAK